MSCRYPPELHEFLKSYIPGHTCVEVSKEVIARFGINLTPAKIKSYKTNHKIKSGTPCGMPKGHATKKYPQEIKDFIAENYKGIGPKEMAEILNDRFNTDYRTAQINSYYKNHGFNSGLSGRFEKGLVPANKGTHVQTKGRMAETQFKEGHKPHNKLPIGSIVLKSDGYYWEKTGEGSRDWKQKHILVWEKAHGRIPEKHMITFKDGNHENFSLENLELISFAENLELTRKGLRSNDKDLTETGILVARLNCKLSQRHKMKEGKDEE